ncbi:MAG: hypothetical protein LBD07_01680, partial [Spirochaetaceae bacterium]|nr:hypothetical protein [Spirochaetaceae bacterium]
MAGTNGGFAAPRGKRAGRACEKRRAGSIGVRQLRSRQSVRQHKPRPPADRPPLFTRALRKRPSARWAARADFTRKNLSLTALLEQDVTVLTGQQLVVALYQIKRR